MAHLDRLPQPRQCVSTAGEWRLSLSTWWLRFFGPFRTWRSCQDAPGPHRATSAYLKTCRVRAAKGSTPGDLLCVSSVMWSPFPIMLGPGVLVLASRWIS